jgi:hypothetical protein
MDVETTPTLMLLNAIAAKLSEIDDLRVRTKKGTAEARSMARVYPGRTSFRHLEPIDPRRMVETGVHQIQTLSFDVALKVTDLVQSQRIFALEEEIIVLLSGFQPYFGLNGTSSTALSPLYLSGGTRELIVRSNDSPIFERIISLECTMERHQGLAPKLNPNPNANWDKTNAIDIYGYLPWQVAGNG